MFTIGFTLRRDTKAGSHVFIFYAASPHQTRAEHQVKLEPYGRQGTKENNSSVA